MTQLEFNLFESGMRAALEHHLRMKIRLGRIRAPTIDDYRQRIEWLCETFGSGTDLRAISYDLLLHRAEQEGPSGKGLKFVTISKRYAFLRWTMREALERGLITRVPNFPRLPSDGTYGTDYHLLGEFEAMRAMLPPPWDTWVTLGFWTAMRRSDLHRARWSWFDLESPFVDHEGKEVAPGRWRRVSTKTARPNRNNEVWMPMDPPLWSWLSKLGRGADHEYVAGFWHRANRSMAKACWQAEVPPLSPNGFRRSAVFRWYVEGRSDDWIRIALGHVGYGHREIAASLDTVHRQGGQTRPTVRSRHYYSAAPIAGVPRVAPKKADPSPEAIAGKEERDRRLFARFQEFLRASEDIEAAE